MKVLIYVLCILLYSVAGFLSQKSGIWSPNKRFLTTIDSPEWSKFVVPDVDVNNIAAKVRYEHPSGILRDTRLSSEPDSDLHIQFVGTSSCVSSRTRSVSCLGLRYKGDVWLFDCGEGAQNHLKGSKLKVGHIRKIFLTHLHGDHSFGLVGLLCSIGSTLMNQIDTGACTMQDCEPVDIYGPEGVRNFVRSMSQLTFSKVLMPHRIHELKNVHTKTKSGKEIVLTAPCSMYNELKGSDIYPDEHGHYVVCDTADAFVTAAAIDHTVPCVGYVFNEKPILGSLQTDKVTPLLKKHFKTLSRLPELDYDPFRLYSVLKSMSPEDSFTLPDGVVLTRKDVLGEDRPGRKIAILGDTRNGNAMIPLAMDADVVIHEATNAYFPREDMTYNEFKRVTMNHGHSTPQMAGDFANRARAKRLLLNHFSTMFKGDDSLESMRVMWAIEEMARNGTQSVREPALEGFEGLDKEEQTETLAQKQKQLLLGPNDIVAAWDQLLVSVPLSARQMAED